MPSRRQTLNAIATAVTAGPLTDPRAIDLRARSQMATPSRMRWVPGWAKRLQAEFGDRPRPARAEVARHLGAYRGFQNAWEAGRIHLVPAVVTPEMAPAPGAPQSWDLPAITTVGKLAGALGLHSADLGWLTARSSAPHYHCRWVPKSTPGRFRLIEAPKPLLKATQRVILRRIIDRIPAHEAACGFVAGRSIRDYVSAHVGRGLLIRIDLEDFFPSVGAPKVFRVFMAAGYPESVARTLTRLVTHAAPQPICSAQPLEWSERKRLLSPHLPQGAPTSPGLANACAFRLDCRLSAYAAASGASYTRYADDLLISGDEDFSRNSQRFLAAAGGIIIEEGFRPNFRKIRAMRPGQSQRACGLVLNSRVNLPREDFDRLKATLTNCVRSGPASQNRDGHPDFRAHLEGKIGWVRSVNPERAEKLASIHRRIDWGAR